VTAFERIVAKPSITTWSRLEPRPREGSMERSLQAQVRDPLWFLSRQWQVGEFAGDDGGSPVQASITVENRAIDGYRAGATGAFAAYDPSVPLETHVERETAALRLRFSAQLGTLFESLVRTRGIAGANSVIIAFRGAYSIGSADPDPVTAGAQGLQWRALLATRLTDGVALAAALQTAASGGTPNPPLPSAATVTGMPELLNDFLAQAGSVFNQPANDPAWQPKTLDYGFAVQALGTTDAVTLEADDFPGGELDWYAFTFETSTTGGQAGAPADATQAPATESFTFLPAHVTFHGMPEPKWWAFEDGFTDFGQLDAEHVDLAKLLVMEFALVYGNDWFSIPVPTPVGCISTVTSLVVTDTFGVATVVNPADSTTVTTGERPWTMFKLTGAQTRSPFIVMAPTITSPDDGDALEDVVFLRDDVAAMAWAVEQQYHGELDRPIDGYQQYLARLQANPPPPPPVRGPNDPQISYVLESLPPDNWIPLVPVKAPNGQLFFRRGVIELPTTSGIVPLPPRTQILTPGTPFFLQDEIVQRGGLEVQRRIRRARWSDGSTFVWMSRIKTMGRGPGWSGLRFDYLRNEAAPSK
jgi:hypothetical protein